MAVETNEFDVVGLNEQLKMLDKLLASDPEMEKAIQDIIRTALKEARSELSGQAVSGLQMDSDPRQAKNAIKSAVYRQVLGGNLSLLSKRKAGTPHDTWLPSAHTGRGGNRRKRSERTRKLQSYWGSDRAFILRFLSQGVSNRELKRFRSDPRRANVKRGSRGGDVNKYGKTVNTGARGSIAPRKWFSGASLTAMRAAADNITARIEELIAERFNS